MTGLAETSFFTFETGRATDVGCVRKINEDSHVVLPEAGLWVVADGMGGHAAGDFASQTITGEVGSIGVPGSGEDLQARFMERLTRANETIIDHAAQLGRGTIGATLVALLVFEDHFACIWSGDSRIYRLRQGQLEQQTRDHTEVTQLLDQGLISPEEAATWPRRNVITRAIGVTEIPECDRVTGRLEEGDTFLLCSDGLNEHVDDYEIADILGRMAPQAACDALIAETLERGAKDNVTVVVMRCGPPQFVHEPEPVEEYF